MGAEDKKRKSDNDEKIWQEIRRNVESLKFGTVVISVHDGRIVQIETSQKTRFS